MIDEIDLIGTAWLIGSIWHEQYVTAMALTAFGILRWWIRGEEILTEKEGEK